MQQAMSITVPTFEFPSDDLQSFFVFIQTHIKTLEIYGAIKIQLKDDCKVPEINYSSIGNLVPVSKTTAKISDRIPVYAVQDGKVRSESTTTVKPVVDEQTFWSSLQKSPQSLIPSPTWIWDASSFSVTERSSFDFRYMLNQSLLKLDGILLKRNITPSLQRCHAAGTLVSLSSVSNSLYSLDYHHSGGTHHWYIIPKSERANLQRCLTQENIRQCLDHEKLIIDPIIFNTNRIRYYRIKQSPRELVVLHKGTLVQRFVECASWNETMVFNLPNTSPIVNETVQCECLNLEGSRLMTIDLKCFRHELARVFFDKRNKPRTTDNTNQTSESRTTVTQICEPILIKQSDRFEVACFPKVESSHTIIDLQSLPQSTMGCQSNNSAQKEHCEAVMQNQHSHPACDTGVHVESVENAMVIGTDDGARNTKVNMPTTSASNPIVSESQYGKQKLKSQPKRTYGTRPRALFVSGIPRRFNKCQIRKHFPGCQNLIVKKSRISEDNKYALVFYRSDAEAEASYRQTKVSLLFGPQCSVDFSRESKKSSPDDPSHLKRKLVVTKIPEHVMEEEIRHLFMNYELVRFCPAVRVQKTVKDNTSKSPDRILTGHAYILCKNEEDARNVVANGHQYKIRDQPLLISFYDSRPPDLLEM